MKQQHNPNNQNSKSKNSPLAISEVCHLESSIHEDSSEIGHLIVHRKSLALLAVDHTAQKRFAIDQAQICLTTVIDLLPSIGKGIWDKLLDQNDKISAQVISLPSTSGEEPLNLFISSFKLLGLQQDAVLLTLEFDALSQAGFRNFDALTGLPDRRELKRQFATLQNSSAKRVALLFLDLVHFKSINDSHGHSTGDQVLIELAQRWQKCVRDRDLVVRYGGDEFVVLLADIDTLEAAQPVIERLVQVTSQPIDFEGRNFSVEVSVGVAVSTDPDQPIEDLIKAADLAMYEKKRKSD